MAFSRLRGRAAQVPAPVLVLGGVVGLQGGAVVAVTVIPVAGIAGTVMLRLGLGALGLIALRRPALRGLDRRAVLLTVAVGLLLAAHHLCFYLAIHRLPLGVAVTLEFAGPLTVVLAGTQRRTDLLWALLAAAGVAGAAGVTSSGRISLIGVAAGLGAGACWAGYIVVFPQLASHRGRGDGLALATGCAALVTVPFWLASHPGRIFTPRALVLGAVVALLSDVLAYSLQSEALGRMPGSLFSILASTEPAAGALFGLVALGQRIGLWQWAGMLAVVAASIGATAARRRTLLDVPGKDEPLMGLLRYVREQRWVTPSVLLIVIGAFTLSAHGRGHSLFWAGILLCAAGVLTAVVGYLSQRPGRDRDEGGRPA